MSALPMDPAEYDAPTDPAPEGEERERFTIGDDAAAGWAMRKLAALRKRQAEVDAIARDEIARIEAWHLAASGALVADTNYFTGLLTHYAHVEREAHGRKSISLPYGTVRSRAGSRRVEVTDDVAFLAWAEQSAPTLIRVRKEPDKAAIRQTFDAADDMVVDPATGEVVPGITVTRSETTYQIETN